MIKKLQLTNFRGIKEGQIELSPLTILVGSNNSGKTAILEALLLAPNPVRQVPYGDTAAGVVRVLHDTLGSEGYAFLMLNYTASRAAIQCDVDGQLYSLEFLTQKDTIHLTTNKLGQRHGQAQLGKDFIKTLGSLSATGQGGISVFDDGPFIGNSLLVNSALIGRGYEYIHGHWVAIMNSGVCRKVATEAAKLSNDAYVDVTLEPFFRGQHAIYAFLEDGRRIRLGDLGEGMQNYLLARILYEMEKPEVLLWDDIESHLNPRMLLNLAEWFSELVASGKQVVVATHSLEAVRIISESDRDKTGVILTAIKDNVLRTKALSAKETDDLLEAGIDVRMAESFML